MIRVTRESPCPICGHTKWCARSDDGKWAYCPRTPGDYGQVGTWGWKHPTDQPVPVLSKRQASISAYDYWDNLSYEIPALEPIFTGIPTSFISQHFELKHDWFSGRWAYPMYNLAGICGVQSRDREGRKYNHPGCSLGLFLPKVLRDEPFEPLHICEGFSDTVALTYIGHRAIGRAHANHVTDVLQYIEYFRFQHVTIVADKDFAGIDGARTLQMALIPMCLSVTIVTPKYKDARETICKKGRLEVC